MPWLKWLPWRFFIRRIARAHGFLDPVALLARLHRFAQPSEVAEPVELLRAGVVFHARGLINARVIQHNLDWVWPYWIERQFDPEDDAFVPRAFSITHVNLTHRNWTAVGLPDVDELPIVDPRGLLTPLYDGWSLDAWVMGDDGSRLLPSRSEQVSQQWDLNGGVAVVTETAQNGLTLCNRASVQLESSAPVCRLQLNAGSKQGGWLVLALRPYNPEGVSFIHQVALCSGRNGWSIDGQAAVTFSAAAQRHHVSDYRAGDVAIHLQDRQEETEGVCEVGMVTAAALFRLEPGQLRDLEVRIPLVNSTGSQPVAAGVWQDVLQGSCQLRVPDEKMQFLYDAALRTLVLHSPGDVYPGPYTYKRFWFRDAAFIIHALLCAGLTDRAERALDRFPSRQTTGGYFHSQEGEWDANGQALWIMQRFCALTGSVPKHRWRQAILRGARWIGRKRNTATSDSPHSGLLPAGFSAEHLGPNDYYYWDDFWGIAGLRAAAELARAMGDKTASQEFLNEAGAFQTDVDRSLARCAERLTRPAMPAAPDRRLDAGAIGSLALGYPVQLCPPDDPRLLDTTAFLLDTCRVHGGFFQDMIHAGINPYLTLHIAQVLLRAGDPRYLELLDTVAALASPTGQWPEAIHPRTGGGCMGDGQHVWAAAEWVMMLRHCFVREEGDRLILCQGIPGRWLTGDGVSFGPAPTAFGTMTLEITCDEQHIRVNWEADWHDTAPPIEVRLPGFRAVMVQPGQTSVELSREQR
ncbi:Discoidin domain protein [hydrothermal vent metagenome]|uniref:Discoidin domain protein n=1 Tax=hydrothermal vent metagenome TaxID=652676 RepID=A0A3B0YF74_9ZZZZ